MRRKAILMGLLLAALVSRAEVTEIHLGDTREAVLEKAGQPSGKVSSAGVVILVYEKARVRMVDGKVAAIERPGLRELETAIQKDARLARAEQVRLERRQVRIAQGEAVMTKKLSDPAFLALPAETRLSYWTQFNRLYPEVNVLKQIKDSRVEMRQQMRWQEFQGNLQRVRQQRIYYRTPRYYPNYVYPHRTYTNTDSNGEDVYRHGGITEFQDFSMFTPGIKGLPGGKGP